MKTTTKYQNKYLRKILANLARDDPKTKEVALNGFGIGNENEKMAQLAMSIVSNTHIKILCLNDCGITSKGAHLLAYALGKNKSLDHVWLNHNKIGSSGADAIASALTKNRTLLTLGLSNNSVGNHGGKALAKALRHNHSITDVFVEGNRMSHKVEDEINRICYGYEAENDGDDDEIHDYQFSCNHRTNSPNSVDDYDAGTVAESVVSKTFVNRTLDAIKEVDYESDDDSDGDDSSSSSSCMSDDEPMDLDFTCFYQKKKESRLSKLKAMTRWVGRKKVKVKPGLH